MHLYKQLFPVGDIVINNDSSRTSSSQRDAYNHLPAEAHKLLHTCQFEGTILGHYVARLIMVDSG